MRTRPWPCASRSRCSAAWETTSKSSHHRQRAATMPSTAAASSGALIGWPAAPTPMATPRFADSEDDEQAVALGPVGGAVDAPVALSRGEVDATPVPDE